MVPNTKAVIGIQNPVRLVNLNTKYWIEMNNIAKHPNWYRKARTCNFVIVLWLCVIGYRLWVIGYGLSVMGYRLWVMRMLQPAT